MPIWQLCANLLIPNCLRSNLSYSPLAALELYVNQTKGTLAKSENDVLNLIKQNSHITYAEIGETLSLGETSVYKILKNLREKNLIHRKGGRVYGYWVVNNESVDLPHIDMPAPPRR